MNEKKRIVKQGGGKRRDISVRAVRRDTPDARRLSRALLDFAIAREEAAAEAERIRHKDAKPDDD